MKKIRLRLNNDANRAISLMWLAATNYFRISHNTLCLTTPPPPPHPPKNVCLSYCKHRRYKEPIEACSSLTRGGLVLNEKEIFLCFALLTAPHYHPMRSALDWLTLKNLKKTFSLFIEYDFFNYDSIFLSFVANMD